MKIPRGLTESDVVEIVEYVLSHLAPGFVFAHFSIDDIKQQGWIEAIKGLEKFDDTWKKDTNLTVRDKCQSFLYVHLQRRLINFKRDVMGRTVAKQSVLCALNIDSVDHTEESGFSEPGDGLHQQAERNEIKDLIDKFLPAELRSDYNKMLAKVSISKLRRDKVKNALLDIIANAGIDYINQDDC